MSSPSPADIQYQLQHIHDNKSKQLIVAYVVSLSAASIAVALRLLARRINRASLKSDDVMVIIGLVIIPFRTVVSKSPNMGANIPRFFPPPTSLENSIVSLVLLRARKSIDQAIGVRLGMGRHNVLVKDPVKFGKVS